MLTLASPTIQLDIRPTIFQVLITIKKKIIGQQLFTINLKHSLQIDQTFLLAIS